MSSIPLPPPPPPPMGLIPMAPPIVKTERQITSSSKPIQTGSDDARSALMADITKGVKLKKCVPNQQKNVQFLDGNNNDEDSSVSGLKGKDDVKCGPFPSALHAELTNTLKKRKTSQAAVDGEPAAKDGVRTFDPNILNTHVPQPTGFKITHGSPNFSVRKVSGLPPIKKTEEKVESPKSSKESSPIRTEIQEMSKPVIKAPLSTQSNGVKVLVNQKPEEEKVVLPSIKELKKQLSVSSQTEVAKKEDKKVQKLEIKFMGSNDKTQSPSRSPKSVSPEAPMTIKIKAMSDNYSNGFDTVDNGKITSPTVKELKKQLSVASQTDEVVKKVDKKIQKLDITLVDTKSSDPKSPLKSPPTRPTVLRVNSTSANGTTKKIRHPVPNFTLPRNPTKVKSPVNKTPSSPKSKSFQKENITTFNKPTISSLQRQQSSPQKKPTDKPSNLTDKQQHSVINDIKPNHNNNRNQSYEIPINFDRKTQVSFAKDLSNAQNNYHETVKTTKSVTKKTDLYYNNINLANVKLEINTNTANVIKVVPK